MGETHGARARQALEPGPRPVPTPFYALGAATLCWVIAVGLWIVGYHFGGWTWRLGVLSAVDGLLAVFLAFTWRWVILARRYAMGRGPRPFFFPSLR